MGLLTPREVFTAHLPTNKPVSTIGCHDIVMTQPAAMIALQARAALVGTDAAKAALVKLNGELVVPAHYTPSLSLHTHNPGNSTGSEGSASTTKGRAASAKGSVEQKTGSIAEDLQRLVADVSDDSGHHQG